MRSGDRSPDLKLDGRFCKFNTIRRKAFVRLLYVACPLSAALD